MWSQAHVKPMFTTSKCSALLHSERHPEGTTLAGKTKASSVGLLFPLFLCSLHRTHVHTHTESEAPDKRVCDEVYFEFVDLWAIVRCLLIQCISCTSWLVATLVLDAGGCAFVTDSIRVREEIQAMVFLTMILVFCCNAVICSHHVPILSPSAMVGFISPSKLCLSTIDGLKF